MTRSQLTAIILGLVLMSGVTASAQEPPSITLPQALAAALQSGSVVRSASAALEGARMDLLAAQRRAGLQFTVGSSTSPAYEVSREDTNPFSGLVLPGYGLSDVRQAVLGGSLEYTLATGTTISLSYRDSRQWSQLVGADRPDEADTALTSLTVTQPLLQDSRWTSPHYEVRVALRQLQRAELLWRKARRDVYLQVAQAFFGVLQAQDEAELSARSVRLTQETLAQTQALAAAGNGGPLDVQAVELQLAQEKLSEVKARQALSLARRQLANALGVPVDESARAVEVAPQPQEYTEAQVTKGVRAADLDVALRELSVGEAQDAVGRAGVGLGLQLSLSANYNDDDTWSAGVNAFWSPTEDSSGRALLAKARRNLEESQASLVDAENAADIRGLQVYYDYLNARQQLDIAAQAAGRAEHLVDLAKERAALGAIAEREVLDAELQYERAEKERRVALHGYLVAVAQIQVGTGAIDRP